MFSDKSRYKNASTYTVTDSRGRSVKVVSVPVAPSLKLRGYHALIQGQRPDHLAYHYLNDGTAFWKIAHMNEVVLPEALSEKEEIAIPANQ